MVTKTLDLGRELGETREKLEVSAESIQIWRRAIEETNGNAESFDAVIIRLRDSIGSANQGNKEAQDGFEALGLSWEDLADKSPEEALQDVLTAANDTLEPTDAAAVKADLLGRSYTGMGGLANDSGEDIQALLDKVADSAVVMGGDAVTSVDEYDEAMRNMRDIMGKVAIAVGTVLIPKITLLIEAVVGIAGPLWDVYNIMMTPLKQAFTVIFGAIEVVTKLLKGDFSGAWDAVLDTAIGVMGNLVHVYNNTIAKIPGVAEIDMDKVAAAIRVVGTEAEDLAETTDEASADVAEDFGEAAAAAEQMAADTAAATEQAADDTRAAYVDDYNESVRLHLEKAESLRKASAEKHEAMAAAAQKLADDTRAAYVDDYDESVRLWLDRAESLVQSKRRKARGNGGGSAGKLADDTAAAAEQAAEATREAYVDDYNESVRLCTWIRPEVWLKQAKKNTRQ